MSFLSKLWKKLTGWLKPDVGQQDRGFNLERKGTNQAIPVYYGQYKQAPCIKVLKITTDKKGGAHNEYAHFICIICEGEIGKLGTVYFNGISENQIDNERYHIQRFTGADNQGYCSTLTHEFSPWKTSARLNGLAYLYVRLKQNKKVDWWSGEPAITVDIDEGLLITDLRDNVVKFSDNLPLCTYDFLTNRRYGKGLLPGNLNTQSFIDEANYNETQRSYTRTIYKTTFDKTRRHWDREVVGSVNETVIENIFSCNVRLDTDKTIKDNLDILLKGMRGILPYSQGKYRLSIEKEGAPVYAFTQNNCVGAIVSDGGSQNERYNQVIIKFRNRLTGEMDEAVFPDNNTLHQTWLAGDGGKLLLGEFTVETIDNRAEALQMGHVIAYRSREDIKASWQGLPETLVVEAGDIVSLDSAIDGWAAKPFRVEYVDQNAQTGEISFQGVEHQNTLYPWAIDDVVEEFTDTSFALPQDINAPTGLAYQTVTDEEIHQGVLSWTDPNDLLVTGYVVEVKNVETDAIVFSQETSDFSVNIPRLPEGSYTATVAAKNALFISTVAVLLFSIALPSVPVVTINTLNHNAVTLSATVGGVLSLNTTFQWQYLGTTTEPQTGNIAQGDNYTFTGLLPETNYNFQCRSVNVAGVSLWQSIAVSTLNAQAVFDTYNLDIKLAQLNQATQDTINAIPEVQSQLQTVGSALSNVALDATVVNALNSNFQQLGLDLITSQGDTNVAFNSMVEKLADTNQFVFEIDEVVGQLLVEGNQISYDVFQSYQFKVDTIEGSLSSTIEFITNTASGLEAAHSKIAQNIDDIQLILGDTELTDTFTKISEVSVKLSRVENSVTQQSVDIKLNDFAQFSQLLESELQLTELLQQNIDFAFAQQQLDSELTDTQAEANESKTLIAALNGQLAFYARNENVLTVVDEASAKVTETLSSKLANKIAQVNETTQTLVNADTLLAERATSLEAKVDIAEGETVSATMQTLARAQVSYCTIGRDSDGHIITSNAGCVAAGGVWIEDKPISELLEVAQVTKSDGSTASAKSFLQTLENETGALQARAFFGLDANGKTGGLTVQTVDDNGNTGTATISLDLTAGAIVLRDLDSNPVVYFDTEKGRHTFKGTIEATELILSDGFVYDKASLKGDTGATGSKGIRGYTGSTGSQGQQGSQGPQGLLPSPTSGIAGLKANSSYLGYWNGDTWKTYIDNAGRIYGASGNALFDFNPSANSLKITTTNVTLRGGGGAKFIVSTNDTSSTAFIFKDSANAVRVIIAESGNITAQSASGNGVADFYSNGSSSYSFYGSRRMWAGDGVSPFTGSHIGIRREKTAYELGDLMVRLGVLTKPDVNNSMSLLGLSSQHKQKTCYGVIAHDISVMERIALAKQFPMGLTQEQIELEDRLITINSVGEGLINVCGLGGNIENGDNLCASSMQGKAQCQGDDLIYNYTVAESHEDVIFDHPEQVVQIACTYKF